jgi:hypothetical protein
LELLLILCGFSYVLVGIGGMCHILSLRTKYHDLFKELVAKGELQNKYPSGVSWFDSNNHWMIKAYKNQSNEKLKEIGELLSELLPYFPPPQNLFFTIAYIKWYKRNRKFL